MPETPTPKNQKSESALYAFLLGIFSVLVTTAAAVFSLPLIAALGLAFGLFSVVVAVLSLREIL